MRLTLFFVLISFAGWATTHMVTNSVDSGSGSLRNTITTATTGDTILFDQSTNGVAIALSSQINITKELVIIGNGKDSTIIDGSVGTNFRLFNITSSCNISGITFQKGGGDVTGTTNTSLWGGAIYFSNVGEELFVNNCLFKDNKAYLGGAIRIQEGGLILRNTIFENNESFKFGGAINTRSTNLALHSILNSLFDGNSTGDGGGAIYQESGSDMTIRNSTFVKNTSNTTGGAVKRGGSSDLNILNTLFYSNTATTSGADLSASSLAVAFNNFLGDYSGSSLTAGTNGNITGNPNFLAGMTGDYRLRFDSPCVNTGNTLLFTPEITEDLNGSARLQAGIIDIGAFEFQEQLYVKANANGVNNGGKWNDAFQDLQDALKTATKGTKVWVAAGTYKPTTTSDRTISFVIPDSVKVYGGFAGNEATNYNLDSRDFSANETILSGDIGTQNDSLDNTHHVIFTQYVSPETLVDGFTITKGNAEGGSDGGSGGGWLNDGSGTGNSSNPTIRNIKFFNNRALYGGGLDNEGDNGGFANPTISNCIFTSNTATVDGGAMYNDGRNGTSNPTLTNCTFTSNTASTVGGAIFWIGDNGDVSSQLTNCIFNANGTEHLYYDDGDANKQPKFTNCTFYGATTRVIRTYFDNGQTPVDFTNCIFWGNNNNIVDKNPINSGYTGDENAMVNITYSIVEEAAFTLAPYASNNNINQDPQFVGAASGIFNLRCDSPARDAGTSTGAPTDDITGFARTGNPDMGAYEFGYTIVGQPIVDAGNPDLSGVPFVTARSKIENTNDATYKGARYVELLPGFEVAPASGAASVFRAEIGGGCSM